MKLLLALIFGFFFLPSMVLSQDTIIALWPIDKIPNRIITEEKEIHTYGDDLLRISKVQEPTIEVYLPAKANANGQAMLILPGGGYQILAYDWEGSDIAKFLNGKGIAGIVVKYRLPSAVSQKNKHLVPLIDAQRALRLVRKHAKAFNIDIGKIGIMGFSAGGHLASTLGTHFDDKVYTAIDEIDQESARPDFMALCYPVISFKQMFAHQGSRKNLTGEDSEPNIIEYFSNEERVSEETPPTFLMHAADDPVVPVQNSLAFFQALREKGVPATMHIYPEGGHGFSLARDTVHLRGWTERLFEWMESLK